MKKLSATYGPHGFQISPSQTSMSMSGRKNRCKIAARSRFKRKFGRFFFSFLLLFLGMEKENITLSSKINSRPLSEKNTPRKLIFSPFFIEENDVEGMFQPPLRNIKHTLPCLSLDHHRKKNSSFEGLCKWNSSLSCASTYTLSTRSAGLLLK